MPRGSNGETIFTRSMGAPRACATSASSSTMLPVPRVEDRRPGQIGARHEGRLRGGPHAVGRLQEPREQPAQQIGLQRRRTRLAGCTHAIDRVPHQRRHDGGRHVEVRQALGRRPSPAGWTLSPRVVVERGGQLATTAISVVEGVPNRIELCGSSCGGDCHRGRSWSFLARRIAWRCHSSRPDSEIRKAATPTRRRWHNLTATGFVILARSPTTRVIDAKALRPFDMRRSCPSRRDRVGTT